MAVSCYPFGSLRDLVFDNMIGLLPSSMKNTGEKINL